MAQRRGQPGKSRERKARTRSTRRTVKRTAIKEQLPPPPPVELNDGKGYPIQPGQRVHVKPRPSPLVEGWTQPGFSGMVSHLSPGVVHIIEFGTWGHRAAVPESVRVQSPQFGTVEACVFFTRWYARRDPAKSAEAEQTAQRLAGRNARRKAGIEFPEPEEEGTSE